MPEKDITPYGSIASRKRTELAKKLGLPLPEPSWGEFNKLRALHIIQRKLSEHAQHVALVLALNTTEDGIRFVTHRWLADVTGRPPNAITKALQEAVDAGLIAGRRTRDGHLYVWLEPAFRGISAQERRTSFLGASAPTFLDEHCPTSDELAAATIAAYRTAWSCRYQIEKHDVQIHPSSLQRIVARIMALAARRKTPEESIAAAFVRTAANFLAMWVSRDGQGESKWLTERFHPLQALCDGSTKSPDADLDWTSQAVLRADRQNAERNARRERVAREESVHIPGPRVMLDVKNPFARLVPRSVQAEMGVPS